MQRFRTVALVVLSALIGSLTFMASEATASAPTRSCINNNSMCHYEMDPWSESCTYWPRSERGFTSSGQVQCEPCDET